MRGLSPEPTEVDEATIAIRKRLGYVRVLTSEDIHERCERMAHRARTDPAVRAAIAEYEREVAEHEAAKADRWKKRNAKATRRTVEVAKAQALRNEGLSIRKIAAEIGRSVGWVAKHTVKPK